MNYKILLVALFSLMLLVSVAGSICIVKADTTAEPEVSYGIWDTDSIMSPVAMIILSPLNNEVLSNNTVIVKVNIGTEYWAINSVYYEADWQEGLHRIYSVNNSTSTQMYFRLSITANFTEIPDGKHRITVYANLHDGSQGSSSIDFITNVPPSIAILSPENKTYYTAGLPLNFIVNEPVKWVGYSLDGKKNITITGNSTITNLTNGLHSITVYANDTSGNMGNSQTMKFSVDLSAVMTSDLSSITIVIAVISIIAIVAMASGLLVYHKKHKR